MNKKIKRRKRNKKRKVRKVLAYSSDVDQTKDDMSDEAFEAELERFAERLEETEVRHERLQACVDPQWLESKRV